MTGEIFVVSYEDTLFITIKNDNSMINNDKLRNELPILASQSSLKISMAIFYGHIFIVYAILGAKRQYPHIKNPALWLGLLLAVSKAFAQSS